MFKAIALSIIFAATGWHYGLNPVQHSEGAPVPPTTNGINPPRHAEGAPTEMNASKGINPVQHSE
ncbi:MAG TPA: hypothetical protein VFX96_08465 [Pyrinomonadaceae bacterium]|nr:hypothetical protein [Pyrinomonadaceae bacterium]